jgi:hypothetical protein
VQHVLAEDFCRGEPVKAFSRSVVVGAQALRQLVRGEVCEIGFARDVAAHAADGIFDAALLPRRVGIAEESLDIVGVELVVARKLGSVVERDGSAQRLL